MFLFFQPLIRIQLEFFLDIDGVLNRIYRHNVALSLESLLVESKPQLFIDHSYEEIKKTIKANGKIHGVGELSLLSSLTEFQEKHKDLFFVIESTWREFESIEEFRQLLSPLRVIGKVQSGYKPTAIASWWKENISQESTEFSSRAVILDDNIWNCDRPYIPSCGVPLIPEDFYGLRPEDVGVIEKLLF